MVAYHHECTKFWSMAHKYEQIDVVNGVVEHYQMYSLFTKQLEVTFNIVKCFELNLFTSKSKRWLRYFLLLPIFTRWTLFDIANFHIGQFQHMTILNKTFLISWKLIALIGEKHGKIYWKGNVCDCIMYHTYEHLYQNNIKWVKVQ
jgi:hypothetical protein